LNHSLIIKSIVSNYIITLKHISGKRKVEYEIKV